MVDVSTAKTILRHAVPPPRIVRMTLTDAAGHVLAKDVRSKIPSPLFNQSAVDGFVVLHGPFHNRTTFPVAGEIKAGDPPPAVGRRPVAYRIFTGAPVPKGAWCVVMQEKATATPDTVTVPAELLNQGANIRKQGSHFEKGVVLLRSGTPLMPAGIGLLAATGNSFAEVFLRPSVGIIVTGNELLPPGAALKPGKVFESNSYSLRAALKSAGYSVNSNAVAVDTRKALDRSLVKAISSCDVILLTGGISVGKYDLVYAALQAAGVKELFYKVAQKPGKPLFAGRKGKKLFFALPGNPAAVLVCYHQYVLPTLRRMSGWTDETAGPRLLPLSSDFELRGDRDLFLRAAVENGTVRILSGQDSDNLLTFAQADALVYLSKERQSYRRGDLVEVSLL